MARYEELAKDIRTQIANNTWRSGEKIPSVRMSCRNYNVSNSTVLQAYQLLESEGWIIAKPQSGYFVAPKVDGVDYEPPVAREKQAINDRLFDFLKSSSAEGIVPFGSAFPDPDLFPLPTLTRNLASAGRKMTGASVINNLPPGSESLRRQIAQRYLQQGISVNHQDIVITSGAMEALNLSLQTVTQSDDHVVIESPAFYGALQAVERLGLKPIEVDVCPINGLNIDQFENALQNKDVKACWLMTTFQNPTGTSLSEQAKRRVVEIAEQHETYIIEDDVYGDLYHEGHKPKPLKAFDKTDSVLLCGSYSKSLCPGYRVGWVVNARFNDAIQKLQLLSTLSSSAPVQLGVAHFLTHESYDNHLRKLRKSLLERKARFIEIIKQYFPHSIEIEEPAGGYFIWILFNSGFDSQQLHQLAIAQGISVAPGDLFSEQGRADNAIRLNFSYELTQEREHALVLLGKLAHQLAH
ncbi:PLP-dependent aminotransferase family protein [Vibrio sp. Isolate31]|uniref:aminotransferase-like domain-containing protein n=1 Tax=unclassified Vibrio TaxID=2614977 RepID=UPI001EFD98D7|nr:MULTISPECIES: PLP-dependent aminotransferase family protein [unclassified Vibrio]MCG9554973.1 PLP-dependent aminotransferase family protein [Vibrio sp. Isolate32]MCG9602854.1 PLP-dependent aminotransferase family protein [Vibrio sp. Isolate31]